MFQDWLSSTNDWLPNDGDYGESSEASDMDIMPIHSQDGLFGFGMFTIPDNVLFEACNRKRRRRRKAKWVHDRVDWEAHKAGKVYKNEFAAYNRMSVKAFDKLVELLRPHITMSDKHAMSSTGAHDAISPEVIVSIGLRFMSGESAKSLADAFVLSRPSTTTRVIDMFLNAVEACEELELRLPTTEEELHKAMTEWNDLSSGAGALWGFIGAIDGWLACTDMPSKGRDLDGNQTDYFSGHYHHHGLNIQAICDAKLRFIYFTVAAPGLTGDARAFKRCQQLLEWIEDFPKECFIGGDNAYPLSDSLVVPFSGAEKFDEDKRTLNLFLSQLRIRIEMAFGRLTTKWRIFRSNLNFLLRAFIIT